MLNKNLLKTKLTLVSTGRARGYCVIRQEWAILKNEQLENKKQFLEIKKITKKKCVKSRIINIADD